MATVDISTVILDSLSTENVKRYVAYIQECFAADLAVRDQAHRTLEREVKQMSERLARLESARAVPLVEAPLESDSPAVEEPARPGHPAGSAPSD